MTKEQVRTTLQELLVNFLPSGIDPNILINGVPPANDPDQLSLGTDLRLTKKALGLLATDISNAFGINFPMDEAQNAGTLGGLVTAVFTAISVNVGNAALKAMAAHIGPVTCPNCGHVIGKRKKDAVKRSSGKTKSTKKRN